ncbi:DinB family protein [Maribacter sp. 2304DJ31-5]|uniref:DinB family protein n=1 Tax=Maribacter sp. 2304DJ31-5 TaxID=3386273 RepID=UPI0039BCE46F
MKIFESSIDTIEQFKSILLELPDVHYAAPCNVLSGASIGQHTRHVIELYLCLIKGYESCEVSYDKRERDRKIETEVAYAIEQLQFIQEHLYHPNKNINMTYELDGIENILPSNYHREVMYNLEHAIHHHALIKIGILHFTDIKLPESFGVAPSTISYRKTCVQ